MSDINVIKLSQKAKCNKNLALIGVFFALLLSCGLIRFGLCKYNPEEPIVAKTIETKELGDKPAYDTACCMLSHKVVKTPVETTETDYDNTACVLLYVSIMIFMFLSLWGAFAFLLKALKSEHEINSKILTIGLEIYKEEQMWKLTKEKKEYELGSKEKELEYRKREFEELEKVKTEFEAGLKDEELEYRKREFEELEKVKMEFEAGLKKKEEQQDKAKQNNGQTIEDGASDSK